MLTIKKRIEIDDRQGKSTKQVKKIPIKEKTTWNKST